MVRPRRGEPATPAGDQSSWRGEVCLRVAKVSTVLYGIATVVLALTIHGRWQLAVMMVVGPVCFVMVGVLALTGRPQGALRAWFVVGPAVMVSLIGFATTGFFAGPSVLTTITMMLAGLLLGRRAMLVLLGTVVMGIAAIGWAMTHGVIAPPNPRDVSMTELTPWIRTEAVMLFAVGLLGTLLVDIVGRLERALEQSREQTLRREEADEARARAEIMVMANKQLESIGQLAAGVAHDFNNNLAAIIGSAELMKEEFRLNRVSPELLDDILLSSQRAAQLTRQLLAYSRKAQMVLVPTDVHQLIDNTVNLLRRSIDPKVQVVSQLNAGNAYVLADGALLDSALLNLLVNARDAMPAGGQLTVTTSDYEVFEPSTELEQGLSPGAYVLIEVLDTGEGIAAEILPNIFEPFFTTKPIGKGTGLGLAAVAGTIKSLKGSIEVESEPGCGTAFRILLPCGSPVDSTVTREVSQLRKGSGRVLLVDDDALVRRAASATLERLGYEVTNAVDGVHALEVMKRSSKEFDLVILDVRMPRMDGAETYDELRKLHLNVPVLIWSGYGGERDVESILRKGAIGFVQKPYGIVELSQIVFDAIHGQEKTCSSVGCAVEVAQASRCHDPTVS